MRASVRCATLLAAGAQENRAQNGDILSWYLNMLLRALALTVPNLVLGTLRSGLEEVPWIGIAVVAEVLVVVVATVLLTRLIWVRRELAKRTSWAVVPADEFDPGAKDVERFAKRLDRTRHRFHARLLRPSAAVRFALASDADGRLGMVVTVPGEGATVLRSALDAAYGVVAVHDVSAGRPVDVGVRPDTGADPRTPLAPPAVSPPGLPALDELVLPAPLPAELADVGSVAESGWRGES